MDVFVAALLLAIIGWSIKSRAERRRVMLLAIHLQPYEIEKLMETLSEGYMRALGEDDIQRRQAIWTLLAPAERKLAQQFSLFAKDFAQLPAERTRIIALPWPVAWLLEQVGGPALVLERWSIDMRALLQLHAQAIGQAAHAEQASGHGPSAKAFTLLAEILLMQHSCHWFCKSRTVASARLLARHQTSYSKVLDSVGAPTRSAYMAMTGKA